MAEGIMKKFYGADTYVQSAGIKNDLEIDGFAISVCQEIDVELSRHRSRSFEEMEKWGDPISSFDLVVALTPASRREVQDLTRYSHCELEYWPISDPCGLGETRDARLEAYRVSREEIIARLVGRWGPAR
jgi:protein-tyrosine-phosphatase